MKYTLTVEALAQELGVDFSVAMDIHLLREYEQRIIVAAKANPELRDFNVFNKELEDQLISLERPSLIKD